MRPRQDDHRIDVVSVYVSKDAGSDVGQRVRGSILVFCCLDPSHYTKAANIIEVDWLKPKEAEVGKVHPVVAILVTSEILLSNRTYLMFLHRLGIADKDRPGGAERIAIGTWLAHKETASRI